MNIFKKQYFVSVRILVCISMDVLFTICLTVVSYIFRQCIRSEAFFLTNPNPDTVCYRKQQESQFFFKSENDENILLRMFGLS